MIITHMHYTLPPHKRAEEGRPDEKKPVCEWKGWDPITLQ